jgi:molybdate transport system substrate-binding protein
LKKNIIMSIPFTLAAIILLLGPAGCSQSPQTAATVSAGGASISVFAGAASKPPLDEAARVFEEETGIKVYLTYGGSGTVLSQIKLSQSGDLYIPGSPDYMVIAERDNLIEPDSTKIIAYLIPVIAVQHGNPKNIQSLADLARPGIKVGIGNPEAVCLGLYAVEILDYNHLLAEVGKNIVTYSESCEKTAALLSLNQIDAVIGWHVFHDWEPDKIDVVYLGAGQLPRIAYVPGALTKFAKDKDSARAFLDFLVSPPGQEIFSKWGYIASEAEARKFAPDAQVGGEYKLPADYQPLVK